MSRLLEQPVNGTTYASAGVSIESGDDIVVLHNDDEVYRTGRVVMGDALQF